MTTQHWKQEMRRRYEQHEQSAPDERRADYYAAFLREEIGREAITQADTDSVQAMRERRGQPAGSTPIAIEADKLYSRQMLQALGMSRRMVNSISKVAIRRGWYRGKDVLAALNVRQAEAQRAKQARHPVKYRATRRAN